jgi:antitoxin HicB
MFIVKQSCQLPADLWRIPEGKVYQCRIWLRPKAEGGFSVTSPVLPEIVTEGNDEDECLNKAREMAEALIAALTAGGAEIPWQKASDDIPLGIIEKRILVNG